MAELSGFEVLVLTKEIDRGLRGAYVNNIFRIGDAQIIRFRGQGGVDSWLVVSPKAGAWLSDKLAERGETTEFTTVLRKLLGRARFKAAYQADLDRIFILEMETGETVKLVLELMPPGNLVVTDEVGRILAIRKEIRSPKRRLVRGERYEPPKQSRLSPAAVGPDDVRTAAGLEKTVGQVIGRHIALPRKYVSELLARMDLNEGAPSSELLGHEQELSEALGKLVDEATNHPAPCLVESEGGKEILVVKPAKTPVIRGAASVSSICDEVLLEGVLAETGDELEAAKQRLDLEARIRRLEREAADYGAQAARARVLAASAMRASSASEAREAVKELQLDLRKPSNSPEAVASLAFDEAKLLESKAREVSRAAQKLGGRASKAPPPPRKRRQLTRRERAWYEKFRWFRTSAGRLAIGGRDAATNSILVRRHLDQDDSVYHASLFGSPFFILKGGKDQNEDEVREVAQATVAFSSAWKTGLGSAEAFWVYPDQVKTAAPSGEYLARGSFAIAGKKNQVGRNVVEIAIGETAEGELTAAPESSIKGKMRAYVVLRPHREKASESAKRVLKDLAPTLAVGRGYTVDDVVRIMPSGGGKVVRKVGLTEGTRES